MPKRTIHLIDIENLAGVPRPAQPRVEFLRQVYEDRGYLNPGDQHVIACNHGASGAVGFGWPGGRLLQKSGEDGADLALIEVIEKENIAARFDRVVIASGDHIFAGPAARLGQAGVEVTVVTPARGISRELIRAATNAAGLFDLHRFPLAA